MDWFSRYVVAWEQSTCLEGSFCCTALARALEQATPTIFTTDQGSQFTAESITTQLRDAGVQMSMDGRGRVFDTIFIERLWRSVKYEHLYLSDHQTVPAVTSGLAQHFQFYKHHGASASESGLSDAGRDSLHDVGAVTYFGHFVVLTKRPSIAERFPPSRAAAR
jgi:transposase InsO family protein